jgi:hypothetical protein
LVLLVDPLRGIQDARDYIAASCLAARSIQAVTEDKSAAMLMRYIRAGSLFQETATTLGLVREAMNDQTEARATISDFRCSVCRAKVGYEELYPPGARRATGRGGEHPGRDLQRHWHYISNGDREGDSELTPDEFTRAVEALAGQHPESFLALYCEKCQLVYCFKHWRVEYALDPDMSFGTCPNGHVRVIDPG